MKEIIKRIPLVKKYRKNKWMKYAYRHILPEQEIVKCNNDPEYKKKKVMEQLDKFPDLANEMKCRIDELREHIDEWKTADYDMLQLDILFSYFAYGFTVNEFVSYDFMHKSEEERKEFMSDRDSSYYGYVMNDIQDMFVLTDKVSAYNKFKPYYKRDMVVVDASNRDACMAFLEKNSVFVKKDPLESCGRSVELIKQNEQGLSAAELYESLLSHNRLILEEKVVQDEELSRFNESSVNTVRCITLNINGNIIAPYCFMKVGRNGYFIDNGAAGGILVGIDADTGILNTDGINEDGRIFENHPDSGIKFNGYQLPEWDKLIGICREMSAQLPTVRYIGWDMAYSENGWVVIEGNSLSEVIGPQATSGKGIRKEMENYMAQMGIGL